MRRRVPKESKSHLHAFSGVLKVFILGFFICLYLVSNQHPLVWKVGVVTASPPSRANNF